MTSADHPYQHLGANRFWKSGVAQRPGEAFDDLWTPRWQIDRQTRFATAGSCFAQHISRWLRQQGYPWVDAEPAPPGLDAQCMADGGWGVFSYRTGNIYTAALLRQWVFWALGLEPVVPEAVLHDGRVYDPFRPLVPQHGHATVDDMLAERQRTLEAMRASFSHTDVLVLTLGLTEGWRHRDGHAYPLCPGTMVGRFDPVLHQFVNQDAAAVQRDLEATFDALRAVNPGMRFLLTVSPVPLTATATDQHVLVATMHAKSVLRTVAGALQRAHDDVDYFPSYELIASHATRGQHYDDNLRTVKGAGVDQVMAHFGAAIARQAGQAQLAALRPWPRARLATADEVLFCEEALLEAAAPGRPDQPAAPLCLLGDSHMGKLSRVLQAAGVPHWGGMVMNGSAWFQNRFLADPQDQFVPLESREARQAWTRALPFFAQGWAPRQARIVSNIGVQSHVAVPAFLQWHQQRHGHLRLDAAEAMAYYQALHRDKLLLLQSLVGQGYAVTVVTDPPTQSLHPVWGRLLAAFRSYELVAARCLEQIGCEVVQPGAHWPAAQLPPAYLAQETGSEGQRDWLHGSPAYYAALAELAGLLPGGQGVAAEPAALLLAA